MAAHAIHPPSQKSAMNQEESRIANSLSAMSLASAPGPQGPIRVHFQIGLFKEMLHVPGTQLSFQGAKKLAAEIIEKKAPESYVIGSGEKLLLFKHEPHSESILRKLGEDDTLGNGDLVEVVLAASASVTEMKYRPHSLKVQSYRTPTFCNHCGEMLWGLVRQGLKCEGCGQDFHKRCALALPSNCPRVARRCRPSLSLFPSGRPHTPTPSNQTGGSLEEISMSKTSSRSRPVSWAEKPVWVGVGDVARVPHTFHIHSYTRPTICQHCQRMLLGLFRQGLQCSDCKFNCHWRCKQFVPSNCRGEGRTLNGEDSGSCVSSEAETAEKDADSSDTGSSTMENAIYASYGGDAIAGAGEEPAVPKQEPGQSQVEISPCFSNNIPLMRVVQSVRQTKRRASGVLKKGWLLHYTSSDSLRKRHYWILDAKSITLYQNENSSRYYKEIPLSEVLQIRGPSQMMALPGDSAHSFELVTGTLVYCVVASKDGEAWEMALRQALMPVQNSWHTARDGEDSGKDSGESQGISAFYQIFSDEVLGSGQFGVVYGGVQRQTRRPVAIKVIDKSRFPNKQGRQTKNEVSILQNLSHRGVVTLEGMFETPAHVFVVMEKLHSDMLEMILSSESGRLPERTTRFLITQVLEALRYLHFLHVAHCDLKPENVLLASPDPFPQVKLCDFGFARIIGKKSFRRSVVGTPAYLAPEVISSSGYNCSLDMWAVGVILYVSLSGTFPFNEDEDLHQQITNATFMYPRHPWAAISLQAVNLINNLLQLVVRRRFSVGKALGHAWLQNYQLWCDLREFEQRVGCRYLTHEEDDERWRRHAQQKGLDFPSNLVTTNVEQDIQ